MKSKSAARKPQVKQSAQAGMSVAIRRAVPPLGGKLGPTAKVLLRIPEKFGKSADWMVKGKS